MRKILVAASVLLILNSCKKYLDVNTNPNDPTASTPQLVLGQAIVYSAANSVSYNTYGAWMVGYTANAGGYGGWGSALTYNYDNTSYTGLWSSTYDNLEDYQYVIEQTDGKDEFAYFNAAARIMRAYNFQFLVDQYNSVPYTNALKGVSALNPTYDKAEDVYKAIYAELDQALTTINTASNPLPLTYSLGTADPMFKSDITKWKQLANTLKLRLLVRASDSGVFTGTPTFDAAGFLTADASVNPGYTKASGKQNPAWNSYHSSYTDGGSARSLITTYFVLTFYNNTKISDTARAKAIYRGKLTPARNQLGETAETVPQAPTGSSVWYSGNGSTYAFSDNYDNAVGVLKSRSQDQPILLAAESYFLQAEARLKGILTTGDDVTTLFNKGIEASFAYLYKSGDGTYKVNTYFGASAPNPTALAAAYHTEIDNGTNYLVNIDLAASNEQKLEAIITQKYVALNMIHGHEAWAEFRRTGYPKIDNTTPLNQNRTFVSKLSSIGTSDRLLGRVLYPDTEAQLNSANVPSGITTGSFVFWDRRN